MKNTHSNQIQEIHSKWTKLREESKSDLGPINDSTILQSFDLTSLSIKWLNYASDWQKVFLQLDKKVKLVKRELVEYYTLEFNMRFDSKDEKSLFIDTDERLIDITEKKNLVYTIVQYCEDVISQLKSKGFIIKNFIDWKKFQNGM